MSNTITLRRSSAYWLADMCDAPNAQQVLDLFGATLLPTPYMAETDGETVRAHIAALNPGVTVLLRARGR